MQIVSVDRVGLQAFGSGLSLNEWHFWIVGVSDILWGICFDIVQ